MKQKPFTNSSLKSNICRWIKNLSAKYHHFVVFKSIKSKNTFNIAVLLCFNNKNA